MSDTMSDKTLIWVDSWPTRVETAAGYVTNPTVEQLEELGYRLKTPEMRQADIEAAQEQERQRQEAERVRQQEVEFLRAAYRQTMHGLCAIAKKEQVDKLEDGLVLGKWKSELSDIEARLEFTELSLQLQHIDGELKRKDGDDAWERI